MNDNLPEYILIHCSDYPASAKNRLQDIDELHKERGFDKSSLGFYVGYHVLLTGGQRFRCRQDLEHGNHCASQYLVAQPNKPVFDDDLSFNYHSLAICVDFDGDKEQVPGWAVPLLKEQIREWMDLYDIPLERVIFHRDCTREKTCPGALITRQFLLDLFPPPPPPPGPVVPVEVEIPPLVDGKQSAGLAFFSAFWAFVCALFGKKPLGASSMNDTYPAWYESTQGPQLSQTFLHIALQVLPVANLLLGHYGLASITGQAVSDIISSAMFIYFSVMALVGYVRAKKVLQSRIERLSAKVVSMENKSA